MFVTIIYHKADKIDVGKTLLNLSQNVEAFSEIFLVTFFLLTKQGLTLESLLANGMSINSNVMLGVPLRGFDAVHCFKGGVRLKYLLVWLIKNYE